MVRIYSERKSYDMKLFKTYLITFLSIFFFNSGVNTAETDIYKKIDLFG